MAGLMVEPRKHEWELKYIYLRQSMRSVTSWGLSVDCRTMRLSVRMKSKYFVQTLGKPIRTTKH